MEEGRRVEGSFNGSPHYFLGRFLTRAVRRRRRNVFDLLFSTRIFGRSSENSSDGWMFSITTTNLRFRLLFGRRRRRGTVSSDEKQPETDARFVK